MTHTIKSKFERGQRIDHRGVWCGGAREFGDWRLRYYVILPHDIFFDAAMMRRGLDASFAALPVPAFTSQRPGVGFVVCHPARDQAYIVLNWWDSRNEIFQHIQINKYEPELWKPADGTASFCVWDSEIIWHERCVYVQTVLANPEGPSIENYLSTEFNGTHTRPQSFLESIHARPAFDEAWPTSD